MKFVVWLEGEEVGPIDQETLEKWVDIDKVFSDTKVRNSLLKDWKEASDFDFLQSHFEQQDERVEASKGFWDHTKGMLSSHKEKGEKSEKTKETAFRYKYLPNTASVKLRFAAWVFDLIPITILFVILFFIGVSLIYWQGVQQTLRPELDPELQKQDKTEEITPEEVTEYKDNLEALLPPDVNNDILSAYGLGSSWVDTTTGIQYKCLSSDVGNAVWVEVETINNVFYVLITIFIIIVLLYYSVALGVFAQTFGMWFWGIFITKKDITEVYLFRAYCFTLMMFLLGVLSPIFVYIAKGRSLHEILTGTMVIGIAAKPKE